MSDLHLLAASVGLARHWRDANGLDHVVTDAALVRILGALGYPAGDQAAIHASFAHHAEAAQRPPLLLTADAGKPLALPQSLRSALTAELACEDGAVRPLAIEAGVLPAIDAIGYHQLSLAGYTVTLAVAPPRCFSSDQTDDLRTGRRNWGPAVQIPALRTGQSHAYGGFGELAAAAKLFGERSADALAISPIHALFPGCGSRFSPYTPSSRMFLNTAFADPALVGLEPLPPRDGTALIAWEEALPQRLADLRTCHAQAGGVVREAVEQWARGHGDTLQRHALFDALLCHFHGQGAYGWPGWPEPFHDPHGPAARGFAADHREELGFHRFAQWLAYKGVAAAQAAAVDAGMDLGLIADLAVGVDAGRQRRCGRCERPCSTASRSARRLIRSGPRGRTGG